MRASRQDTAIRDAILVRMQDDPRFDARGVEVVVRDGFVVLRGVVPGERSVRLAEEAALEVEGVESVRNALRVGVTGLPPPQ